MEPITVKEWRVAIDKCIKDGQHIANSIARGNGGREVARSITELQEAKM